MYKYIFVLAVFCCSCSSGDDAFCECLSAGEELNNETQKFFDTAPSEDDAKRIEELKTKKNEACKNYTMMGGDEMRKLQEACE